MGLGFMGLGLNSGCWVMGLGSSSYRCRASVGIEASFVEGFGSGVWRLWVVTIVYYSTLYYFVVSDLRYHRRLRVSGCGYGFAKFGCRASAASRDESGLGLQGSGFAVHGSGG